VALAVTEQPRAVVFDFDLTLADSSQAVADCITFALDTLGFPLGSPEAVRRTIGQSLEATLEALTGNTDSSVQRRFKDLFVQRADEVMVEGTELLDGALPAVSGLRSRGVATAIVSTKYRYRIEAILGRHRARDLFDVIVGGEDVTHHKPHPEGIRRAIERLGLRPSSGLYVGDHLVDAEAAMSAEIPFVGVLTGAVRRDEFLRIPHVAILDSVSALPGFLFGSTPSP